MDATDLDAARAALLAERARLLEEVGETIVAPDQMTYGSQAAAASQVFEQQRDLALRDRRRAPARAGRRRPWRGSTTGTFGACVRCGKPIAAGAARGAALGGPLHRLPARSSTRRAMTRRRPAPAAAASSGIDAIRAAADRLRGVAIRTPLVAVRAARGAAVPQGRVAPADRRVQDPRRLRDDRVAVAPTSARRGVITYSSGNHAQGVARAARAARASRRSSSCRPTRRAIKRERVEADGAEIVIVGTASDERQQRRRARSPPSAA